MLLSTISDFILINTYFYKCCIVEYETSYKTALSHFNNNNNIKIFDDVYNLYLAIYISRHCLFVCGLYKGTILL